MYASLKEELKICPSHGAADGEEPEDLIAAIPPDDGGGGWRRCAQTESDMPTGLRMGVSDDPLQIDRNSSHWAR